MTLTPAKLAEIEAAARKATPGPWRHGGTCEVHAAVASIIATCSNRSTRDAAYLALLDPATVLALVASARLLPLEKP